MSADTQVCALYPRTTTYLVLHRGKRFRVHARRKLGHPLVDDLRNVAHLHKQQQAHTICHRGNIVIEGRRDGGTSMRAAATDKYSYP